VDVVSEIERATDSRGLFTIRSPKGVMVQLSFPGVYVQYFPDGERSSTADFDDFLVVI
jgi:hypothetical protein